MAKPSRGGRRSLPSGSALGKLGENKDVALIALRKVSGEEDGNGEVDDGEGLLLVLKSFCVKMDALGFWRFVTGKKKELESLRAQMPLALAECLYPARFVLESISEVFPVDKRVEKSERGKDLGWACVLVLESLIPVVVDPVIGKSRLLVTPTVTSRRVIGSGGLQKSPKVRSGKLSRTQSKKGDEGITIDHLHRLNPKNVSAWNMKRLMRIVRHGTITTLDEQILDTTPSGADDYSTQIRSEVEAKAAAKKIFQNLARHRFIYMDDLMRFLRDDEAMKTLSLFEGASESRRISKSSLKNWVVNAFRERRALALTLNDTKTAVNKLHRVLNILVGIGIFVVWLLILGIATTKFLLYISSQLVLVAFIFGNTCKTVFEAIVFLFVMHPYDVGDRCEIEGVQMVVEEMNILTTVFLRYDNTKLIYPNSVLATKPINNFYRSPDMGDSIEFFVHIATPADKIAAMRQRIISYVESKKEHWYAAPMIILKDFEELNRLRLALWLTHKMNYQDMGEKFARRSLLIEEMVKIFRELDIQYRLLPVDINVRAMPPVISTRLPTTRVENTPLSEEASKFAN